MFQPECPEPECGAGTCTGYSLHLPLLLILAANCSTLRPTFRVYDKARNFVCKATHVERIIWNTFTNNQFYSCGRTIKYFILFGWEVVGN